MKHLDETNKDAVLALDKVVLKFGAGFCQPCKVYNTILEALPEDFPLYSVDCEVQPDVAMQFGVRSIPTTILLKNGIVEKRVVGVQNIEFVKKMIE